MPLHTYVHVCYVFGAEKLKVDHLIILGKQIFIVIPSESFLLLVFFTFAFRTLMCSSMRLREPRLYMRRHSCSKCISKAAVL